MAKSSGCSMIDHFTRESLNVEVDTSIPALRVIMSLENIISKRGNPAKIRSDNGPEFICEKGCVKHHITGNTFNQASQLKMHLLNQRTDA
jgi:hypothetical protein